MKKQNNLLLGENEIMLGRKRTFEVVSVEMGEIQEDIISIN